MKRTNHVATKKLFNPLYVISNILLIYIGIKAEILSDLYTHLQVQQFDDLLIAIRSFIKMFCKYPYIYHVNSTIFIQVIIINILAVSNASVKCICQ